MDYFNPDSILAQEESFKVKFDVKIRNTGINTHVRRGNSIEMPFYTIGFLLENGHCEIADKPLQKIQNDLDADASLVDLQEKPFYSICKEFENKEYLSGIFFQRIGVFHSLIVKDGFSEDDVAKMSSEEKRVILKARKCYRRFLNVNLKK